MFSIGSIGFSLREQNSKTKKTDSQEQKNYPLKQVIPKIHETNQGGKRNWKYTPPEIQYSIKRRHPIITSEIEKRGQDHPTDKRLLKQLVHKQR